MVGRRWWTLWAGAALMPLFAGCTFVETPAPEVRITVADGNVMEIDCFFGQRGSASDPEWCHILNVTLSNDHAKNHASNQRLDWEAVGDDGGVYSFPRVEGPEEVAAGRTANLTLKFDAPKSVRLDELLYVQVFLEDPVRAEIPDY